MAKTPMPAPVTNRDFLTRISDPADLRLAELPITIRGAMARSARIGPRYTEEQKRRREEKRRERARQRTQFWREKLKNNAAPETAQIAAMLLKAYLTMPDEQHRTTLKPLTRRFLETLIEQEFEIRPTLRRMKRLRRIARCA
jgi:hypothetical protein